MIKKQIIIIIASLNRKGDLLLRALYNSFSTKLFFRRNKSSMFVNKGKL